MLIPTKCNSCHCSMYLRINIEELNPQEISGLIKGAYCSQFCAGNQPQTELDLVKQ